MSAAGGASPRPFLAPPGSESQASPGSVLSDPEPDLGAEQNVRPLESGGTGPFAGWAARWSTTR